MGVADESGGAKAMSASEEIMRRRFLQAAAGSILLPTFPRFVLAQVNRTLSVERRMPDQQARADANLNTTARHALVIGNSRYARVTPLENPANDASAIAEQLRSSGFQVDLKQDLTREAMLNAIATYSARIAATKSVGLFFFAGHGLQLSWRNFLVPVDAAIAQLEDVPDHCVDLAALINGITKANNPMNVVVLDACRDNPFKKVKVEAKGLSQLDAPPGTLLAFATSPGNVASDGEGSNGLYTENLLRELKVREAKIEDVFKRVRLGVRRKSNGQQIPWESTSLEEDFYFLPPKQFMPVTDSEANQQFEEQLALWEKVKTSRELAPLEDFLRRYPNGEFAELAQLALDSALAREGEKRIEVQSQVGNPFTQGFARADTSFKVGDFYGFRVLDVETKSVTRVMRGEVTEVSDDEVMFSGGLVLDRLGNTRRTADGFRFTDNQNMPLEFLVGRKWTTRFRTFPPNVPAHIRVMTEVEYKIVGREKIQVPAGSFDCYRVEGRGESVSPAGRADIRYISWYAPEKVRRFVAQEFTRKTPPRSPVPSVAERIELVSFKQS
jgi:uncharacterized caspase-like protein